MGKGWQHAKKQAQGSDKRKKAFHSVFRLNQKPAYCESEDLPLSSGQYFGGHVMGFSMQLLVLYPQHVSAESTVWMPQETLFFGRVTRLQKLSFSHLDFDAHSRAAICVVSCLLGKAFAKLGEAKPVGIAPTFLFYDYGEKRNEFAQLHKDSIDPGYDHEGFRDPGDGRPSFEKFHEHNRALTLDEAGLQAYLEAKHPIIHGPMLWESCTEIASFLDEAETKKTDEWRELVKDPIAYAIGRAWREYLREVATIGARALYVFS
jgi:hypothetical protein